MNENIKPLEMRDECQITQTHDEKVARAKSLLPEDDKLFELSEFFKLFGDSTRIKILEAINGSELCVCDISEVVGVSSSGVSHQLRILRQNRLVKATRVGKETYYTLDDDHIGDIIRIGYNHINERRGLI